MKPLKDLARLGGVLLATSVLFTAGLAVHASPVAAVERAACPAVGPVSSPWGPRFAAQRAPVPFSDVTAAEFHDGVDIAAPHGAPIYAVQAGEVIYSETADPGGYGQYIQIRHDDGSTSEYGHMSRRLVDRGESVRRGQQIAKIGSEGSSTGPHLHLRIYPGAPGGRGVNPQVWLRDRGITLPCTPADNPVEEPDALVGGSKDFTGDGVADVLGRHPNGDLYLYPASGPGLTYASKVKVHSGWNVNNWLYAASLDYTPGVDLVGRNAAGDLLLYSNTGKAGTGMFDPTPTKIGSGWNVMTWLAVADVTGDKLGDMVGRRADGRVFVYPNTGKAGTGMFGPALYAGSGWNGMNAILAADYTGDGRADLVGRDGTGKLWLYPANADNAPTYDWRAQIGSGWHTLNGLSVADTNNDNLPDIIARDHAGKLWRYTNNGKGLLATYADLRAYVGSGWQTITALS